MSVTPDSADCDSRVAQCEREIAAATDESQKPHTPMEHLGILIWELDWRAELDRFLQNRVTKHASVSQ